MRKVLRLKKLSFERRRNINMVCYLQNHCTIAKKKQCHLGSMKMAIMVKYN